MIVCLCPHCGKRLEIPDEYAGRTGACALCGGKVQAPAAEDKTKMPVFPAAKPKAALRPGTLAAGFLVLITCVLVSVWVGFHAKEWFDRGPANREAAPVSTMRTSPPSSPSPAAGQDNPTPIKRGITVPATEIGSHYSAASLVDFVSAGNFDIVIIDWAWITAHWDITDFSAVQECVRALQSHGVQVAAMYRPRFLRDPTVPVQVKQDGSPAFSHGYEIRFTSPVAREWGLSWGRELLKKCPEFEEIIIYNPRNVDASPETLTANQADPDAPYKAVAQFLAEARAAWRSVKPTVRLGAVYGSDPAFWRQTSDIVDAAHPFLSVKEDVDADTDMREVGALQNILGDKLKYCLAKVTWGETDKVAPEKLAAFDTLARAHGLDYVFWTFDTLFDSPLYDPAQVAKSLHLDFARLATPLRAVTGARPPETAPGGQKVPRAQTRNDPKDWVYFVSKENPEGKPAQLVLSFGARQESVPVGADSMLISYLADRAWGVHGQLSVSLNDSNRVLLRFSLPQNRSSKSLEKADLVLDMRLAQLPPKDPFDVGVHCVTAPWDESSTNWLNQPAFDPVPGAVATLDPQPGIVHADVTALVQAWLGGTPNYGLLIKVVSPLGEAPVEKFPNMAAPVLPRDETKPGNVIKAARDEEGSPGAAPLYARSAPRVIASPEIPLPPMQTTFEALPWPHQAPGSGSSEKEKLSRDVWIINNFPLYQPGDTNAYCHNGFDIVVDNGTPMYAMKDGYVKSVKHQTIIIADAKGGEPSFGWAYTHLGDVAVAEGDFIRQGTRIGRVDFKGLPHIHLEKVYSQAPYWGEWQYALIPDHHFTYPDDDPPVVQTPFYFLANGTDTFFKPDATGTVTVQGDVDIVVGMREQGLYAHGRDNGFGDRLAVARIAYEIRPVKPGKPQAYTSFDFTRLAIKESPVNTDFNTELTKVVYRHPLLFEPERKSGDKVLTYYVITNCPPDEPPRELRPEFAQWAWRTAATDASGKPVFPDGSYDIVVTAWDFTGHSTTATTRITVRNSPL
jgi:murein DD-endopeptidase MepM/ murein hydrolase activator NlpD